MTTAGDRPSLGTAETNHRDLVVVEDLVKYFPVRGGILQRTSAWFMQSMGSPLPFVTARRSAWWGSPAAARPRWAGRSSA
jgi:hypothetical protein